MKRKSMLKFLRLPLLAFFGLAAILSVTSTARAQHDFGAGIIIGAPTGFSFKYNLSKQNSVDAALAWSGHYDLILQGDYLWNHGRLFTIDQRFDVNAYYGVGGAIRDPDEDDGNRRNRDSEDDDMRLAIRGPFGLQHMFERPRIEIFAEVALLFEFIPETDADLDLGIGGRYFF